VELASEQKRPREWIASATIVLDQDGRTKRIPIFGRRRMIFGTEREANAYALELAKLWIDGKLWGANGHGTG
jgi:hypothetical protein